MFLWPAWNGNEGEKQRTKGGGSKEGGGGRLKIVLGVPGKCFVTNNDINKNNHKHYHN